MIVPYKCCRLCASSGSSRLRLAPNSYNQQTFRSSAARWSSTASERRSWKQRTELASREKEVTLFQTLFRKTRPGSAAELTHDKALDLSLSSTNPLPIARPTTKFGLDRVSVLPPKLYMSVESLHIPTEITKNANYLLRPISATRRDRHRPIPSEEVAGSTQTIYQASQALKRTKRLKAADSRPARREYHWLKWKWNRKDREQPVAENSKDAETNAIFKELLAGSLIKNDAQKVTEDSTSSKEVKELHSDELPIPEGRVIDVIKEEHEAGIKSYKMTEVEKKGRIKVQHGKLNGKDIKITEVSPILEVPVAQLKRGLSRVLFNPSVHFTRDPRSHVYNFDPELERVPQADEFAFHRLPQYVTASEDPDLYEMVKQNDLKFYGSTSTLTKALSQIYFYISGARPVNLDNFSIAFSNERRDFTAGAKLPAMLWVRSMPDGKYAVDNDKRWDVEENVLSDLGRVMEKMVTSDKKELDRFLLSSPESAVSEEERKAREAYRYCRGSTLLMRSQLDCQDSRLPGSGTFDIKTRAAVVIRHDRANYEENSAYDVHKLTGLKESFEKEFYDMSRSAFLKYSMQVRIGGMDGIFVVYHNTARIFGYQYVSLQEMDEILHGTSAMGEQAFNISVTLLEKLLEEATALFPKQTINLVVDANTRESGLYAFVTPQSDLPIEAVPVVRIKVLAASSLNGQKVEGVVDFEKLKIDPAKIDWTIEYEIEKTPMTEEGYSIARQALALSRRKATNMTSLNLPTGKSASDMAKSPEEIDPEMEKENMEKQAVLKWKDPDHRIVAMRKMAQQSGRDYESRMAETKGKKPIVWTP